MTSTIKALFQRQIAYAPVIAKATGSIKLTILWQQMHYWSDKTQDPDGWVYKTREQVFDETGLGRKEQESARELGGKLGVLDSEVRGSPPTTYFRANEDRMIQLIELYLGQQNPKREVQKKPGKPEASIAWLRSIPQDVETEMAEKYRVSIDFVRARAEDVIDYCEAKGKKYSDYKATLRNFIKSEIARSGRGTVPAPKPAPKDDKKPEYLAPPPERTQEEQERLNARMAEMRKNLGLKLSM